MFAALSLERDPAQIKDLVPGVQTWAMEVGVFATVGLICWLLFRRRSHRGQVGEPWPAAVRTFFTLLVLGTLFSYLAVGALRLPSLIDVVKAYFRDKPIPELSSTLSPAERILLTVAGGCAVLAVLLPLLVDVLRLRWRRIWALARLSFKEAIRSRVLWGFSAMLLLFLFGSWFIPYDELKPEDQVRNYITLVYWGMVPLLLFVASLLAASSIPTDVRLQTIHTVVTKPVERFELILGRFLGYGVLMSLVLIVMTSVSLLYVIRSPHPAAAAESFKARDPLYGELLFYEGGQRKGRVFEGGAKKARGENVGKEWDYRSYISGGLGPQFPIVYAVWNFESVPAASFAGRDKVRCEFNFDIYRTTKGEENKGVFCEFVFTTPNWSAERVNEYERERDRLKGAVDSMTAANQLAEKYGIFEFPSKEVVNFHTLYVDLPPGLFKNAAEAKPSKGPDAPPPLRAQVRCISRTQFLGMAKYDLYLRQDQPDNEGVERWLFYANFYKSASGLWLRLCLVIGIAVTLSTYLSAPISWLATIFLYMTGMVREFVQSVAEGTNAGGGPAEAAFRLVSRTPLAGQLEDTVATKVVSGSDVVNRWIFRRFMSVIPDVDRFDFTDKLREGFNISLTQCSMDGLYLVAYLLPWAVLAYYLLKSREIAAPT
jgi:hypothetical protein